MQEEISGELINFFKKEGRILVAYIFGSHAKGTNTRESDIDIAILLSETPEKTLDYQLYLVKELSGILGDNVDLVILNNAPPLLKNQVIKHGKVIYSASERSRIIFEAKAQSEYLDLSMALKRYDECLIRKILA